MTEKPSEDIMSDSREDYDDKKTTETFEPEPDLTEQGGRRQSVALNIIENPLKVSLSDSQSISIATDPVPLQSKTMPRFSRKQ